MSTYSIPYASDETLKDTIIGYYRSSSSGGEVSTQKAAEGADISEDNLKRQRGFLAEVGILYEGDDDYGLTDVGQEIGRALRHDREDDAREPFGEVLREWEATSEVLDDLGPDYCDKEAVLDSIGFVTDHELGNYRQKAGANGLIDLYVWTDILEKDEDGEYRAVGFEEDDSEQVPDMEGEKTAGPTPDQSHRVDVNIDDQQPVDPPRSPEIRSVPFDVSLELTGDEDPVNVRDLFIAVRTGLEAEIGDGNFDSRSNDGQASDSEEDSSLDSFLGN